MIRRINIQKAEYYKILDISRAFERSYSGTIRFI